MGASLSSDVYQYKVDGHLEGTDHCVVIADDIIIYGFDSGGTDHNQTVRQVMKKAQEVGMCFDPTKCQFRKGEVKLFGMMLTRQGMVPDPTKIEALRKLPEPRSESLLQSFLSRLDPKIADLTHNLRGLLKKDNEFKWIEIHTLGQLSRHCVKMINFYVTTDLILICLSRQMQTVWQ